MGSLRITYPLLGHESINTYTAFSFDFHVYLQNKNKGLN